MAIKVTLRGLGEVRAALPEIPKTLERAVLERMSQIAYDEAYGGATRHNQTGALSRRLFNRAIPGGREVGHDLQRAPHALFVNWGTRPHIIRPKDKKSLRWAAGGRFIFAKFVKHPGYVGDPYLVRAADAAIRQFAAIVEDALKEAR